MGSPRRINATSTIREGACPTPAVPKATLVLVAGPYVANATGRQVLPVLLPEEMENVALFSALGLYFFANRVMALGSLNFAYGADGFLRWEPSMFCHSPRGRSALASASSTRTQRCGLAGPSGCCRHDRHAPGSPRYFSRGQHVYANVSARIMHANVKLLRQRRQGIPLRFDD